jgi:hypothetical protein
MGVGEPPTPAERSGMRVRFPKIERPSLALLAAILIAMVPSTAWAASTIGAGKIDEIPDATTNPATAIGTTGATLTGTVNPNKRATVYHFDWGPTSAYGSGTASVSAGSGSLDRAVSAAITGLAPATVYHFRVVATNDRGTTPGEDRVLTTIALPPVATTGTASAIDQTNARVSAEVNPNGSPTTYHFEVGPTTEYGSQWPASDAPAGSDSAPHAIAQALSGLFPGTTYHYRVVATNASGMVANGADHELTTAGVPPPPGTPGASGTQPLAVGLPPATPPVLGRSATIAAVSGTVLVELPGAASSLSLDDASTVPVGTRIDATAGTVRLTNVRDASGKLQTGTFWGGSFTVRQTRGKKPSTVLGLSASLACPKAARHLSSLTRKSPRTRQLWGKDNNGRFVTRGRSAVATVRGTLWLLRDTCAGTLVKVTRGEVSVRDLVRKRTVIVKAGHSYLARTK